MFVCVELNSLRKWGPLCGPSDATVANGWTVNQGHTRNCMQWMFLASGLSIVFVYFGIFCIITNDYRISRTITDYFDYYWLLRIIQIHYMFLWAMKIWLSIQAEDMLPVQQEDIWLQTTTQSMQACYPFQRNAVNEGNPSLRHIIWWNGACIPHRCFYTSWTFFRSKAARGQACS